MGRDEATELRDAVVKRYDVVIVGGGIAGLAIAERLAREANRQGTRIKILLVEQQAKLGMGASGGLEGWYHAGALYSKERRLQFFANFLSAFEDLYNWYHFDPLFRFRDHCNLREIAAIKRPQYDLPDRAEPGDAPSEVGKKGWFLGELTYLLPREPVPPDPDQERFDREEWRRIITQVQNLVNQAFFENEWVNERFGCCQAPYVGRDVVIPDLNSSPAPPPVTEQPEAARGEADPADQELRAIMDRVGRAEKKKGENPTAFTAMPSRDAALNSWQVLRDLTEAAIRQGVTILTGYKMDPQAVQISPYGAVDNVTGLLLTPATREPDGVDGGLGGVHIIASQYIFSLGLGFEESELLHNRLDVHVKVQKNISVMAVTTPALCGQSFVRMDLYRKNDFNHICRQCWTCDGQPGTSYSIIADSNALPLDAPIHQRVLAADQLLAKAERYFGDRVRSRLVGWYVCEKTEFPSSEDDQRDYSYYWGPNWADWDGGEWEELPEQESAGAQEPD